MDQEKNTNGVNNTNDKTHNTVVTFADIRMYSFRNIGGTLFSRRNKCFVLALCTAALFCIFLLNLGLFSTVPTYNGDLCRMDEIPLQGGFDKAKFAGNWYATFTKGTDNVIIASLLEFYDVKMNFVLQNNGEYLIKSVGGKFLGMWCPEGLGHMTATNSEYPQKMAVLFDTPTGKKMGIKPLWIVKTDYTSYAVVYSCWAQTEDGFCKASSAYAAILQRSKQELPIKKMEVIRAAVGESCINPNALRKVKHKGYCKSNQKAIS